MSGGKTTNIQLGKPIDIRSFQINSIQDFKSHVEHIKTTRTNFFNSMKPKELHKCPICGSLNKQFRLNIYGGQYYQCLSCTHCFVINIPTENMIKNFYSTDTSYSSTYTDKGLTEARVKQIAMPKVEWVIEQFQSHYGKKPSNILDVGAGGGHFVHACKLCGIDAEGIEISRASRTFCKENFGIDLKSCDFVKDWQNFTDFDVITFWGVLEHTPNPVQLLKTAYKVLVGKDSLVIAEAPHWNSLSTIIQTIFSDYVVRHLDPLVHIHCFTDESLSTAFDRSNFVPVSAWYFGMDAYELIIQLSHLLGDESMISDLGNTFPVFQDKVDKARLSEELVLAGKPVLKC